MSKTKNRILVPVDFSGPSDAALDYALAMADESGAEVELLHVWSPRESDNDDGDSAPSIFADTPQGVAMAERLTEAEYVHPARVSGRLEFGEEPSQVILDILEREPFDLVVMGRTGDAPESGRIARSVTRTAPCQVVTLDDDDDLT